MGCVVLVQRDFLTFKCSIVAVKPRGQMRHPWTKNCPLESRREDADMALPWKPSPDDSGRAISRKQGGLKGDARGSNTLKNYYGVLFSQKPA